MMALAVVTRHDDGTLTYEIDDTDGSGIVEVSVEALVELFRMAGIKPGAR
jgi:hypothetical protein